MTRFLLIRHALTDTIGQHLAGRARDVPLNEAGRRQAEDLARRVAAFNPVALYTSPLLRARETAAPLAERLGLTPRIEAALVELDFGEWTGVPFGQLDQNEAWHRFNRVRSRSRPPGGETMLEVQARAVSALEGFPEHHPHETVIMVSHGDVIRGLLLYYAGSPIDAIHRFEIEPASVSILDLDSERARILGVNLTPEYWDISKNTL